MKILSASVQPVMGFFFNWGSRVFCWRHAWACRFSHFGLKASLVLKHSFSQRTTWRGDVVLAHLITTHPPIILSYKIQLLAFTLYLSQLLMYTVYLWFVGYNACLFYYIAIFINHCVCPKALALLWNLVWVGTKNIVEWIQRLQLSYNLHYCMFQIGCLKVVQLPGPEMVCPGCRGH